MEKRERWRETKAKNREYEKITCEWWNHFEQWNLCERWPNVVNGPKDAKRSSEETWTTREMRRRVFRLRVGRTDSKRGK